MKLVFLLLTLLFVDLTALSQQPVKVNLLEYFDKIIPPPASAKAAYDQCGCNNAGRERTCISDSMFKGLLNSLQKCQIEISSSGGTSQTEMMKKAQDPEFQKKMKKMTKEEKMQLAMQMQAANATSAGVPKPEPESVLAVLRETGKISEVNGNEAMNLNTNMQAEIKRQQELEGKHSAVDDWEAAEIKKLPDMPSQGEGGGGPDPKAVYAVKISAFKKHLAIVEEELKRAVPEWTAKREQDRQLFAAYEKGLEKIHFGDDAKNPSSKSMLATTQTLMIGRITNLVGQSQSLFDGAAGWYDRYVLYQKTKPE